MFFYLELMRPVLTGNAYFEEGNRFERNKLNAINNSLYSIKHSIAGNKMRANSCWAFTPGMNYLNYISQWLRGIGVIISILQIKKPRSREVLPLYCLKNTGLIDGWPCYSFTICLLAFLYILLFKQNSTIERSRRYA